MQLVTSQAHFTCQWRHLRGARWFSSLSSLDWRAPQKCDCDVTDSTHFCQSSRCTGRTWRWLDSDWTWLLSITDKEVYQWCHRQKNDAVNHRHTNTLILHRRPLSGLKPMSGSSTMPLSQNVDNVIPDCTMYSWCWSSNRWNRCRYVATMAWCNLEQRFVYKFVSNSYFN